MLSAKEFYTLQKQGKLHVHPQYTKVVSSLKQGLEGFSQSVKNAETFLHPQLKKKETVPIKENTSTSKKKRRKKKKKSTGSSEIAVDKELHPSNPLNGVMNGKVDTKSSQESNRNQRPGVKRKLEGDKKQITAETSMACEKHVTFHKDVKPNSPDHAQKRSRTVLPMLSTEFDVEENDDDTDEDDIDVGEETEVDDEVDWGDLMDIQKRICIQMEYLLSPLETKTFFAKYFEKNAVRIQRSKSHYMEFVSTEVIDDILRQQRVMFTEHLDLAIYSNGQRKTLNPPGRAFRSVVWDHYNMGCSVRFLCPQMFIPELANSLSLLQEHFGCFVGANLYLTPPGSQGFAPHFDDVEVFIIQLEGSKLWRVYKPRDSSEELPRYSSPNFSQEELGKPSMTATLTPGDMLYLPRGYIHQAATMTDHHSLHLTISTYQRHTWGDLLQKLLPVALKSAIDADLEFRQGLPVGFLQHVGGFSGSPSQLPGASKRDTSNRELRQGVVQLLRRLADRIAQPGDMSDGLDPVLVASDMMAVDLVHQSLPPQLDEIEAACHVTCQGDIWSADNCRGDQTPAVAMREVPELDPDTLVRLVRWSAVRAVRTRLTEGETESGEGSGPVAGDDESALSDDSSSSDPDVPMGGPFVAVYHSLNNTEVYKQHPQEEMALQLKNLAVIDHLAKAFPNFVPIDSLPLECIEEKMSAAVGLYEAGFLVTNQPLFADDGASTDEDNDQEPCLSATDSDEVSDVVGVDLLSSSVNSNDSQSFGDDDDDDGDQCSLHSLSFCDDSKPSDNGVMSTATAAPSPKTNKRRAVCDVTSGQPKMVRVDQSGAGGRGRAASGKRRRKNRR